MGSTSELLLNYSESMDGRFIQFTFPSCLIHKPTATTTTTIGKTPPPCLDVMLVLAVLMMILVMVSVSTWIWCYSTYSSPFNPENKAIRRSMPV